MCIFCQVFYTLDVSQYAIGADKEENFYYCINKALQKCQPGLLFSLSGHDTPWLTKWPKFYDYTAVVSVVLSNCFELALFNLNVHFREKHNSLLDLIILLCAYLILLPVSFRYLYFLLSTFSKLPKEPEGDFYRGVGPEAVQVSCSWLNT